MQRRPPRSTRTDTRFPYTTLFRSAVNLQDATPLTRRGVDMRLPAIHKKRILELFAGAMLATAGMHAFATGMEPETSVVILNEADGETSINDKNPDGTISLLHSVIEDRKTTRLNASHYCACRMPCAA